MTTLTFKYNKEGTVTDRVFVELQHPTDKYFGIDITELDLEDQVAFAEKVEAFQEELSDNINELMIEYDIKHMYRFFKPANMTDIVSE